MSERYIREIPPWWVFTRPSWFVFFLREITSLFVAWFAVVFLLLARAVYTGPEAYASFIAWLSRPGVIFFHVIAFVAVVWHSITWFLAAPKAARIRIGDRLVPPNAIIAAHYAAWFVISMVLLVVML